MAEPGLGSGAPGSLFVSGPVHNLRFSISFMRRFSHGGMDKDCPTLKLFAISEKAGRGAVKARTELSKRWGAERWARQSWGRLGLQREAECQAALARGRSGCFGGVRSGRKRRRCCALPAQSMTVVGGRTKIRNPSFPKSERRPKAEIRRGKLSNKVWAEGATGSRTTGGSPDQSSAEAAALQALTRTQESGTVGTHPARERDSAAHPLSARQRGGRTLCWASAFEALRRDQSEWPRRDDCHQHGQDVFVGFHFLFDSRGNFATGFKKCMLPGNINDRITTFANKHGGFDRHLFLKTGQKGG